MEGLKKKNRVRSFIKVILWVLLVQFILINISAGLYAYKFSYFYDQPESNKQTISSRNIFTKTWKLFTGPRFVKSRISEEPNFSYDTVKLTTANNTIIDAWFSKVDSAKGTVILFHGLLGNKSQLLAEAYEFLSLGYSIMLVDFRAHGNSGGNICTSGAREKEEVKSAYDYIIRRGEKNIFFYGASMGAVAVMKALSDYGLKPRGIIMDMPFESLQDHLKARARILGFPQQPFAFLVTFWIGIERGFNGFNHKTVDYVKKISCPVLLQWGKTDPFVLEKETNSIFKNFNSADKQLVIYENAGHVSFLQNDPGRWLKEVSAFLKANVEM